MAGRVNAGGPEGIAPSTPTPLAARSKHRDDDRQQHQGHQCPGDLGRIPFHQPDDQEGGDSDRHRPQVGAGNGFEQGHELEEVALGVHRARHGLLEPFRRRQHARPRIGHVGRGEDLPHLVGEDLDAEAGDEAHHHGTRQEVGEECQPEDPEDEEHQAADHGQGQGVLQTQRVPGCGKGDQGGADQPGDGGIGARHQVARAREQGEDRQRNDGRIEAGHGGQAGHLGIADVEGDHQGGQGDARRDLAGDVGQLDASQSRERAGPADPGEHAGSLFTHRLTPVSRGFRHRVSWLAVDVSAAPPQRRRSQCTRRVIGPRTRKYGTMAHTTATISICAGVERPQDQELIRGVEHARDDEDPAEVLEPGAEEPSPLGRAREEGPHEDRFALPDVLQVGPDREDGDHGRHDHQSKVQRPARPAEELLDASREQRPGWRPFQPLSTSDVA